MPLCLYGRVSPLSLCAEPKVPTLGLSRYLGVLPKSSIEYMRLPWLETPLGALAHQLYSAHQAAGNGGRDFSSIIQALRDRSPA